MQAGIVELIMWILELCGCCVCVRHQLTTTFPRTVHALVEEGYLLRFVSRALRFLLTCIPSRVYFREQDIPSL